MKLTKAYNFKAKVTKNTTVYGKWRAHVPSVSYRTHVQTYGWQNDVKDGAMSGTQGQSKRLEAIQIQLTGELSKHYDVYYRVHCQTYGWLG